MRPALLTMALSLRRLRITRVSLARASISGSLIEATRSASKSWNASRVVSHLPSTTFHDMPLWKTALLITSR